MKVLILGSTGMLGYALVKEARTRNFEVRGIARKGADICVDISNDQEIRTVIESERPDAIINTIAIVNIDECEMHPDRAYLINARPASICAEICRNLDIYYIHISTDHFYAQDGEKKHDEQHPIKIINEYARTKYAGECFALTNPHALVVRTNIVGFHYSTVEQPTFVEWIINALEQDEAITLFDDYFASSIDVLQFSRLLFDLIKKEPGGVINVACRDVRCKKDFIEALARQLNHKLSHASTGRVSEWKGVPRGASLGLDVTKAEKILEYRLPGFEQVVTSLVNEYRLKKRSGSEL